MPLGSPAQRSGGKRAATSDPLPAEQKCTDFKTHTIDAIGGRGELQPLAEVGTEKDIAIAFPDPSELLNALLAKLIAPKT